MKQNNWLMRAARHAAAGDRAIAVLAVAALLFVGWLYLTGN